jgi:hypothetical protein
MSKRAKSAAKYSLLVYQLALSEKYSGLAKASD